MSAELRTAGAHDLARRWTAVAATVRIDLAQWQLPDAWLAGEQQVPLEGRTLAAVPTPGHTDGHCVFIDEAAGVLFAGDHVLPAITPSIGFGNVAAELPLRDFLWSLERVRTLPDLRLLPAHGPVTASSPARVGELLAHHDHRLDLCRRSLAAGARTAYEVAQDLPWTLRGRAFAEPDLFNAALAVHETKLHLDLLVARGQADCMDVDGVGSFSLVPRPVA